MVTKRHKSGVYVTRFGKVIPILWSESYRKIVESRDFVGSLDQAHQLCPGVVRGDATIAMLEQVASTLRCVASYRQVPT